MFLFYLHPRHDVRLRESRLRFAEQAFEKTCFGRGGRRGGSRRGGYGCVVAAAQVHKLAAAALVLGLTGGASPEMTQGALILKRE